MTLEEIDKLIEENIYKKNIITSCIEDVENGDLSGINETPKQFFKHAYVDLELLKIEYNELRAKKEELVK